MSKYYICLNKEKDIALYYLKTLHRKRIYRQSYPLKPYIFNGKDINKDLELFKYKDIKNAQKLCKDINSKQSTIFEPVEVEDE